MNNWDFQHIIASFDSFVKVTSSSSCLGVWSVSSHIESVFDKTARSAPDSKMAWATTKVDHLRPQLRCIVVRQKSSSTKKSQRSRLLTNLSAKPTSMLVWQIKSMGTVRISFISCEQRSLLLQYWQASRYSKWYFTKLLTITANICSP